jgi:hypothetical protein
LKGCFFKIILLFTVVIAIIYYVVKYHGNEIWDWGSEKLIEYAIENIKENVDDLDASEYKDSLKVLVSEQFEKIKDMDWKEISEETKSFVEKAQDFIEDNVIDSEEFKELKKIVKEK